MCAREEHDVGWSWLVVVDEMRVQFMVVVVSGGREWRKGEDEVVECGQNGQWNVGFLECLGQPTPWAK